MRDIVRIITELHVRLDQCEVYSRWLTQVANGNEQSDQFLASIPGNEITGNLQELFATALREAEEILEELPYMLEAYAIGSYKSNAKVASYVMLLAHSIREYLIAKDSVFTKKFTTEMRVMVDREFPHLLVLIEDLTRRVVVHRVAA